MNELPLESLGPYRIDRLLGRGGMGSVYLGVHQQTQQQVAIKVLAPYLVADESFRERFEVEIESLKKIKHPRIVEMYGFGQQEGHLFYVMELVPGRNLQEELSAGRRFTWREAVTVGIDICSALKHAHNHGIIHRDIKPANIMLCHDDRVKLTDFGIAKLFGNSQMTAVGGVLGTVDYMSPEQAEGLPATPKSDLYSLGGVLYAILAGRAPLVGRSAPEVIHKVRYDRPAPVGQFAADVPRQLERLLDQLLEKDPHARPPTALALAKQFRELEKNLSVSPPSKDTINGQSTPDADSFQGDPGTLAISPHEFIPQHETSILSPPPNSPPALADRPTPPAESADKMDSANQIKPLENPTYVVVDDALRRQAVLPADPAESLVETITKWSVLVLMLLGIVGGIYWASRPATADQLWERVDRAVESDTAYDLLQLEDTLAELETRFPEDQRTEELPALRREIQQTRLLRKLERSDRIRNRKLSVVERALREALATETTQPHLTAQKLSALIDVFRIATSDQEMNDHDAESPETRELCLAIAADRLAVLEEHFSNEGRSQLSELRARLTTANILSDTDPTAAKKIYQGLITLYQGKPWAEPIVSEAKAKLGK